MRSTAGYWKFHRKMREWQWYDDPVTLAVWVHVLNDACWKKSRVGGEELVAGQLIIGLHNYAGECGVTVGQLRLALKKLAQCGAIAKRSTNRYTVITVQNWKEYQGKSF